MKVGEGSWGVKTEITPTMTAPPKPYQTTTHHCSQSVFCYDTGNIFDNFNKEWVGEYHHHV
jgi:hypothetical protein